MESLCVSTKANNKVTRKHKKDPHQLVRPNTIMSEKTKDFLQKICYKRAASVDMTQFGFMKDRRIYQVNMLVKPLREQLEKIWGKPSDPDSKKKRRRARKPLPATQSRPITKPKPKSKPTKDHKKPVNALREYNGKSRCVNFNFLEEQPSG